MRAYAQTSGVWVRGILKHDYGVDLDSITWVTMEDAHLAEYDDPPIVHAQRRPARALRQLMLAGELAAIMGEREVDPSGIRPVIPDAEAAAQAWIERTGIVPINHMLAVKTALLQRPSLAGRRTDAHVRGGARDRRGRRRRAAAGLWAGSRTARSLQMRLDFCGRPADYAARLSRRRTVHPI